MVSSDLRIGGLASGIDTDSVIKDLMRAHRTRLTRYQQDKTLLEWKQQDYRNINNLLRALRDATFNLRLQGTFLKKSAVSSQESVVTATAGPNAQGTYDIVVTRLASVATKAGKTLSADPAHRIDPSASLWSQQHLFADGSAADPDASVNFVWGSEGDRFSFTINGETFTFSNQASLNQIISAINANDKAGVTMFYDSFSDKVVIATKATGDNKAGDEIVFDDPSGFLNGLLQFSGAVETGGENAQFSINGFVTQRTTNTFEMNGVTFTLKGVSPDPLQPARVTVNTDTEAIYNAITEWVKVYNSTIESIYAELREPRYPDYRPLTDEQIQEQELTDTQIDKWEEKARSGLLKNDRLIAGEMSKIRMAVSSIVEGLDDDYNSLSAIGITTGAYHENGKLHIDEDKLRKVVESNPEQVMKLFTNSSDDEGEVGIARKLYTQLEYAIDRIADLAGNDGDTVDSSFIGEQIRSINRVISNEEARLQRIEDRYWRQFTELERLVAQLNSQSSWLLSMFSSNSGR